MITYPRNLFEDALVKVYKFIFHIDFIILDIKEDDKRPLIFGRPFYTRTRALIDIQIEEPTMRVEDEEVTFKVCNSKDFPPRIESKALDKKACMAETSMDEKVDEGETHEQAVLRIENQEEGKIEPTKSPTCCF